MTKSEFYYERKAAGVCVRCGSPDTDGKTRCKVCRKKASVYENEKYKTLWMQGKCVRCKQPSDGYVLCPECRQKQHEQYVAKRKAMGARLFVL